MFAELKHEEIDRVVDACADLPLDALEPNVRTKET
jgi:hypothetical protein